MPWPLVGVLTPTKRIPRTSRSCARPLPSVRRVQVMQRLTTVSWPSSTRAWPTRAGPRLDRTSASCGCADHAALIGVAASIALIGATFAATEASNNGANTTAAIQAPHGKALRTATFETSQGHALGQIVVYGGSPGWVFMKVDLPTSDGTVKCELRMMDGSVVAAGTVDLHHGTGVLSKNIHVDTSRLQGATLYSPSGAAVGSATFT